MLFAFYTTVSNVHAEEGVVLYAQWAIRIIFLMLISTSFEWINSSVTIRETDELKRVSLCTKQLHQFGSLLANHWHILSSCITAARVDRDGSIVDHTVVVRHGAIACLLITEVPLFAQWHVGVTPRLNCA